MDEVLKNLDRLITVKENGHQGSLEGAQLATFTFHNAILLTEGLRQGVKNALKDLDSSMVLQLGAKSEKEETSNAQQDAAADADKPRR